MAQFQQWFVLFFYFNLQLSLAQLLLEVDMVEDGHVTPVNHVDWRAVSSLIANTISGHQMLVAQKDIVGNIKYRHKDGFLIVKSVKLTMKILRSLLHTPQCRGPVRLVWPHDTSMSSMINQQSLAQNKIYKK